MAREPAKRLRRLRVESLLDAELVVTGEGAHYVEHVLRLRPGDALELFDGAGLCATAELVDASRGTIRLRRGELRQGSEAPIAVTVALAIPKGERADWAVEKLTELGVQRIAWLACERSVVLPKGASRGDRWGRVAEAAARQCGRASVPDISGPLDFEVFVAEPAATKLVAHPGSPTSLWEEAGRGGSPTHLLIGPEGGLTASELAIAEREGYTAVGLAPHVLRIETAAVAAAATVVAAALARTERVR